jgi:hypothetical protein
MYILTTFAHIHGLAEVIPAKLMLKRGEDNVTLQELHRAIGLWGAYLCSRVKIKHCACVCQGS